VTDWMGLTFTSLALIWAAIFLAGLVRGLTGFGLAIILIPLISLIIPPERAVLLGVLMGVLTSPLGFAKARNSVDPAITRPMIWSGIAASPIGLYALTITPPDLARSLIALIAVASFFVLIMKRAPEPPRGKSALLATGVATGLLGGFAAIPGPPVIHYFVRASIPAATARDAMIIIFFWSPMAVAVFALIAGRLDWPLGALALSGFPVLAAGNALGSHFFGRLSDPVWRGLVLLLIAGSAVGAVLRLMSS
jgi:uncharacterized protein